MFSPPPVSLHVVQTPIQNQKKSYDFLWLVMAERIELIM